MRVLLLVAVLGLTACGSDTEVRYNPSAMTPKLFSDLSARCEPYGGVQSIEAMRRDSLGAEPTYEIQCNDYTEIKVNSRHGRPKDAAIVTAAPVSSK